MTRPVLIADDHPLFREALKQALQKVVGNAQILEASSVAEAQDVLKGHDVGLMLLDLHMDDSHGFTGLICIRQDRPALPVVVVSGSEDPQVVKRAIDFGAAGFIPKSSSLTVMSEALKAIMEDGDIWIPSYVDLDGDEGDEEESAAAKLASLTPAQLKVLTCVVRGLLNKQIAYEMDISEATVKAHMTAIFRKLDVINRTQAVLVAKDLDVVQDGMP